jgi:hypothetical protein
MAEEHYLGNPLLKKANTRVNLTVEQLGELTKCSLDPVYFARNYMKIVTLDHGLQPFEMFPFQERLMQSFQNNRFNIAMLSRQSGKSLQLTTPIPTPNGWTTMGDITVGDKIFSPTGKIVPVISKTETMYEHDCYEITFDNSEKITADAGHLWEVNSSYWSTGKKVITTEEICGIYEKKTDNKRGKGVQGSLYIETSKSIELPSKDLKIDPYLLGLWLGDGYSHTGKIVAHKDDYNYYKTKIEVETEREIDNCIIFKIKDLQAKLKEYNLIKNKHIPQEYLRSSHEDRLNLLRGLMDSDGSVKRNSRAFEFYQKNYSFITQFVELLSTIGIKTNIRSKYTKGVEYYTVSFTTEEIVFNLPRKIDVINKTRNTRPQDKRHYIHSIKKVKSVPVACIQVDSDDHLFLCGKTFIPTHNSTTVVSYLLHYAIFNDNVNIAVLANKANTARDLLNRLQTGYENLPKWLQQGVCSWNKGSLEIENGSKIFAASTSASSVRGGSYNIIFLDEFAFVPQQVADNFMSSVYPTITSGKDSKVIIVSTPFGMNHFYKMWDDAIKGKNKYVPTRVYWDEIPGRDQRFKEETIANIGQTKWDAEFECAFLGSSDTLISGVKLSNIVIDQPIRSQELLDVYDEPQPDRIYVITVDIAQGVELDYSAFIVFDATQIPYKVVAKYRNNNIPALRFPDVIEPVARAYNDAYILCEVNNDAHVADILHNEYGYPNVIQTKTLGRGGQVAGQNFSGKGVKYGIKMSKPAKSKGCMNLKQFIEEDKLIIRDFDIYGELTTYVSRYNSFSAEEGKNDDLVSCLVLFSWIITQEYFKEMTETDIRKHIREEHEREMEENEGLPFGFAPAAELLPEITERYLSLAKDGTTDVDGNVWFTADNDDAASYFWEYNY